MQKSTDWIDRYDLSSLRVIATAGEICDRSTWQWLNDVVGKNKVEILDSWWQTETGSPMINPRPSQQGDIFFRNNLICKCFSQVLKFLSVNLHDLFMGSSQKS